MSQQKLVTMLQQKLGTMSRHITITITVKNKEYIYNLIIYIQG